jgi:hypothetical protein
MMIKLKLKRFIRFYARGGLSHVSITGFIGACKWRLRVIINRRFYKEAGSVLDIGCGNGEYSLRLDSLRKFVKLKRVLKSLDYKLNIRKALSEKRKFGNTFPGSIYLQQN